MSKKQVAIDVYPFHDEESGDRKGWLFELARDRLAFSLLNEGETGCKAAKALQVSSLTQETIDDDAILWIASEVKFTDTNIRTGKSKQTTPWGRRKVIGFASGTIVEWKAAEQKTKQRGFEIENLCGGEDEGIETALLAAIEGYWKSKVKTTVKELFTNKGTGEQPSTKFYRLHGFKEDDDSNSWLRKHITKKK